MDQDALCGLQGAWESPEQKECVACMNDFERDYWMGTEVGQLGGYGFQGAIFGVDGSCKDGKMGSGCCKFQGEEADKCARVGREEEGTSSNRPELGGVVLALQSAALSDSDDVLLLCDNAAVLCAIKKWVGQGGKATLATARRTVPSSCICRCSRMRARLSPPRVLLPHTCTQDGWFLQPKRRPARLPRRTVPSNCICRCSRMRARLPLHILLLHTQVSR
jgi:ribonuclease HI